jgi:hypothetical protein
MLGMPKFVKNLITLVVFAAVNDLRQVAAQTLPWAIAVQDSTGASLPGAVAVLHCNGREQARSTTDASGTAIFSPSPANGCILHVRAEGFKESKVAVSANSLPVEIQLTATAGNTEVTVSSERASFEESSSTAHGLLGQEQIAALPSFNRATGFTDMITRTTPGVAADANGFAHPLGEHADTSISLDGQPITDQQAKVFSNQIDPSIIQSLVATTGAPGVEFGDKTSLVIEVMTRTGVGQRLAGELSSDYGSFGTSGHGLTLAAGSNHWGNFLAVNGSASGRFLDTPEIRPFHDHGNSGGAFDRIDWQPNEKDSVHLNLGADRSWFQTPNSYDTAAAGQDQRSQIRNLNAALGWSHVFTPELMGMVVGFYRHDEAQYFPSANPPADATATLTQNRTLTNRGFRMGVIYAKGIHTAKAGGSYWHTPLHERFDIGLTDPLFNAVCMDAEKNPVAAVTIRSTNACAQAGFMADPDYLPNLLPYDLSRGGTQYRFNQKAKVVEGAIYGQEEIKLGQLVLNVGLRYDLYNGLSRGRQVEPRLGAGWRTPGSSTLLRASYARLYETPYNENLIFASESSANTSGTNPFASFRSEPVRPGTRNQFNVGFEQGFGKHLSVDADFYWKFTHTAFDFDTLFGTPITFSVAWRKSKIDGLALRVNFNDFHGLTAYSVMGHVRSRFFTPAVGGVIFNSVPASPVFRIDHGEEFEQTTNVRYQFPAHMLKEHRPWIAGTWRYNSGLALPNTVPVYTDALQLTADEQAQMGLYCGEDVATPQHAIRKCNPEAFGATRIRIPAPGTQNDDRNPVRVSPRTLLDFSAGDDEILHIERAAVGVRFSVLNATNKVALYNFLSPFSGTHFVPPRSYQMGLRISF